MNFVLKRHCITNWFLKDLLHELSARSVFSTDTEELISASRTDASSTSQYNAHLQLTKLWAETFSSPALKTSVLQTRRQTMPGIRE